MYALQIINKILQNQDFSIVLNNGLDTKHFINYEEHFLFIKNFYDRYGKVPDIHSFLEKYPDYNYFEVKESEQYLVEKANEYDLYAQLAQVLTETSNRLQTDSYIALDYLKSKLDNIDIKLELGTDIIKNVDSRLERHKNQNDSFISTGFDELDEAIDGWQRGEELVTIFAKTGHGKSWFLINTLTNAWKKGFRVGYLTPEMSADKIGYRFDTSNKNFANKKLVRGEPIEGYEKYLVELSKSETPFYVLDDDEFGEDITVTHIEQFIINRKLDILGIDGISYLKDRRAKNGDSLAIQLGHIAHDLMKLSKRYKIPILIVAQANRKSDLSKEDSTPDLDNIRDSDGIAHNSTKVIAVRKNVDGMVLTIRKNRDGELLKNLVYKFDYNTCSYMYLDKKVSKSKVNKNNDEESDSNEPILNIF